MVAYKVITITNRLRVGPVLLYNREKLCDWDKSNLFVDSVNCGMALRLNLYSA